MNGNLIDINKFQIGNKIEFTTVDNATAIGVVKGLSMIANGYSSVTFEITQPSGHVEDVKISLTRITDIKIINENNNSN